MLRSSFDVFLLHTGVYAHDTLLRHDRDYPEGSPKRLSDNARKLSGSLPEFLKLKDDGVKYQLKF